MTKSDNLIPKELIERIRNAKSITILTGAGISAESGVPTFRESRSGLWEVYRPEDLATPEAFQQNPELVWEWYSWRLEMIKKAVPNPAHIALVTLEKKIQSFTLITQNIDGLHQRAGSEQVMELHGSIHKVRCVENNHIFDYSDKMGKLPLCSRCGSLLRPNIVWFGEALPDTEFKSALNASRNSALFFSIGTSSMVEPAASLPYEALRNGAIIVEINPQPTPLTVHAKYYFPVPAGKILPAIVSEI